MLVSIPPNMTVSGFMGYLKGKSTMIFERYAKLKRKYMNRGMFGWTGSEFLYISRSKNKNASISRLSIHRRVFCLVF